MNAFASLLRRAIGGEDLGVEQTAEAFGAIMDERISSIQAAALL